MSFELGPRRGSFLDVTRDADAARAPLAAAELAHFETLDLLYRTLCAMLHNYAPLAAHPGGSISSGRIAAGLAFDVLDLDPRQPQREDADLLVYAAGHKALGLYALQALRSEILRLGAPELLPPDPAHALRLEDLLGFRRNPTEDAPLFKRFGAKALDGHPTPSTPFVPLATGASGVGMAAAVGLALAARDVYGSAAPRVHVLEGEGGLTPGRVAEALAAAGTARLDNLIVHVDWNQASIDSELVCREGRVPGDYVQWEPAELFYLHDWNVIRVPDGKDLQQVVAAQRRALVLDTGQPTAIVYRTVKGWRYGSEGRLSHGTEHRLCSDGFFEAISPLLDRWTESVRCRFDPQNRRCACSDGARVIEECFWDALQVVRRVVESEPGLVRELSGRLRRAHERLGAHARRPRDGAPVVERAIEITGTAELPAGLEVAPGASTTLRAELGRVLNHLNRQSAGALFVASADLVSSTGADAVVAGFPEGFYNAWTNPGSRVIAAGGICEDAMTGILCGLASFGRHIGVATSYGAFLAPLGHVAARLHAIGAQARRDSHGTRTRPVFLVCAHAGLKTGEDGPTHADPQPLQLVQENFPAGSAVCLTPWEPQELWPLVRAALALRPALILPFVTRPAERVPDRSALGLADPAAAAQGVYVLRQAHGEPEATLVLQGSGVTLAFVQDVLPRLEESGIDVEAYYVASAELFSALPAEEQERVLPARRAQECFGITEFTLPTLYRWVRSERGRAASLHPFRCGRYLGGGTAASVMRQAGLDGESQYRAIVEWVGARSLSR